MQREVWSKILRDRNHFEKLDVEGLMLTLILKNQDDNYQSILLPTDAQENCF